jgi:hypothetical protein
MIRVPVIVAILSLLAVSLACTVQIPREPRDTPIPATETAPVSEIAVQASHSTDPTCTPSLPLSGCWNVREGAGVDFPVLRVQCGGEVLVLGWAGNGFIRVGDGEYICNRAFGYVEPCE